MKKTFTLKMIKEHILLSQYPLSICDLKDCALNDKSVLRQLNFFVKKTEYINYLKEEYNKLSIDDFKDNINYYWGKFQNDIRFINI